VKRDDDRPAHKRRFDELDADERLAEFLRLQAEREAGESQARERQRRAIEKRAEEDALLREHALKQARVSVGQAETEPVKGVPGRPAIKVSKETMLEIFRQSLERTRSTAKRREPTYEAIADANGVKRAWVTPIVKWAEKHQRDALRAIAMSEIPPRFSTYVKD
jgi:hypothetical protein